MFSFLLRNKHWPIALDIGGGSIRMLQLRTSGGRLAAAAGARWKFPPSLAWSGPDKGAEAQGGAPCAFNPQRRAVAIEAVRDMLKHTPFRGRRVISSLPTGQMGIKNVRLPHSDEASLQQSVTAEMRERFNFDVKSDQVSYLNAGQVRQGTEQRDEIIIMAAPSKLVEGHLAMLDEMGLCPQHVDAEPIAMFRPFERFLRRTDDEQAISVLVDIGLTGTRVIVARGRQIVFIKNIDLGGWNFTQAVANGLNLTHEEAAELRKRTVPDQQAVGAKRLADETQEGQAAQNNAPARGLPDPNSVAWTVHDALRAQVEALAREVALCLRYCSVTFRGLRPQSVTVIGGEAYDQAVLRLLSENLGIECVVGQPLRGIDTSEVDLGADRRGTLAEWSICAGLAVRNVGEHVLGLSVPQDAQRMTA